MMVGESGANSKISLAHSLIDLGFWHKFSELKLNKWGLDESPQPITGFFGPCKHPRITNNLTLLSESFSSSNSSLTDRNKCPLPGTIYNMNTIEGFSNIDSQRLLKEEAEKMWDDIQNGEIERDPARLLRFFVISFADLKQWEFHYCVAFPSFLLDPPATIVDLQPASKWFSLEEAKSVSAACNQWRSSTNSTVPFFLVTIASNSHARIRHLNEWQSCQQDTGKILFGFYDPCHLPNRPGWPLGNFLAFLYSRWNLTSARFFCYRESRGFADLGLSLIGEAQISLQDWKDHDHVPEAVGWEINNGKKENFVDLSKSLDPKRLAESSAELNLLLMKWRAFPKLNMDLLYSTKCLLFGAGTLGCNVARLLMSWGVCNITLVDCGKVAISNPLRQNLYTMKDIGKDKATAAANALKSIYPSVNAEGVVMAIPMPGHPVSSPEEERKVLDDCENLQKLVESHDVVFLLTDTRESRWLPTLLCANANKIAINAALGFDSYLAMRHGAGPASSFVEVDNALSSDAHNFSLETKMMLSKADRLGCYFCSDVVAPINSTSNRTLDQQCTVTRPGLAYTASCYAVELLVGLLHHPFRIYAPPEISGSSESSSSESSLGIVAHQIRGSLSQLTMMTLVGRASSSCTACSEKVLSEFRKNGVDFILNVINHPTYLEDLTGLTELQQLANTFQSTWDVEEEDDDGIC